jgi:hypothetical protein
MDVRLGQAAADPDGAPGANFELRLEDGEVLQGELRFHWDAERKQWSGWEGLGRRLRSLGEEEDEKP